MRRLVSASFTDGAHVRSTARTHSQLGWTFTTNGTSAEHQQATNVTEIIDDRVVTGNDTHCITVNWLTSAVCVICHRAVGFVDGVAARDCQPQTSSTSEAGSYIDIADSTIHMQYDRERLPIRKKRRYNLREGGGQELMTYGALFVTHSSKCA